MRLGSSEFPDHVTLGVRDRLGKDLTVTVRYTAPLRFRMWLATIAFRFGIWCVGGSADIGAAES
jgi:hypothetical protein